VGAAACRAFNRRMKREFVRWGPPWTPAPIRGEWSGGLQKLRQFRHDGVTFEVARCGQMMGFLGDSDNWEVMETSGNHPRSPLPPPCFLICQPARFPLNRPAWRTNSRSELPGSTTNSVIGRPSPFQPLIATSAAQSSPDWKPKKSLTTIRFSKRPVNQSP
jgi:hypothetical protein